jgi:NADH-quinone oxidoreductase subunit C
MAEYLERLADQVTAAFGDRLVESKIAFDELTIEIRPKDLRAVMRELRDREEFQFKELIDLCGVDYAAYGQDEWTTERATNTGFSRGVDFSGADTGRLGITGLYGVHEISTNTGRRFASVYHLLSLTHNLRIRVKTFCEDDNFPIVDSVVELWAAADWFERESFDLYGILYEGHPDLRRILTDYGFVGHPFRKDFPLIGNVEMRYDPDSKRVIYQPVTIEPRVLVPRVIREDNRYAAARAARGADNV